MRASKILSSRFESSIGVLAQLCQEREVPVLGVAGAELSGRDRPPPLSQSSPNKTTSQSFLPPLLSIRSSGAIPIRDPSQASTSLQPSSSLESDSLGQDLAANTPQESAIPTKSEIAISHRQVHAPVKDSTYKPAQPRILKSNRTASFEGTRNFRSPSLPGLMLGNSSGGLQLPDSALSTSVSSAATQLASVKNPPGELSHPGPRNSDPQAELSRTMQELQLSRTNAASSTGRRPAFPTAPSSPMSAPLPAAPPLHLNRASAHTAVPSEVSDTLIMNHPVEALPALGLMTHPGATVPSYVSSLIVTRRASPPDRRKVAEHPTPALSLNDFIQSSQQPAHTVTDATPNLNVRPTARSYPHTTMPRVVSEVRL